MNTRRFKTSNIYRNLMSHPDGSDSDGSLYAIDSVNAVGKLPAFKSNVAFDAVKIPFYIDTGSSVNILDGTTYQKLCSQLGNIQLSKVKIKHCNLYLLPK